MVNPGSWWSFLVDHGGTPRWNPMVTPGCWTRNGASNAASADSTVEAVPGDSRPTGEAAGAWRTSKVAGPRGGEVDAMMTWRGCHDG